MWAKALPKESKTSKQLVLQLITAVQSNDLQEVDRLLKKGTDANGFTYGINVNPIQIAAENGNVAIGKRLLDCRSIDMNATSATHGYSALCLTCYFNKQKFAALLLRKGANANYPNRVGQTPAYICVRAGSYGILRDLMRFKADINIQDCFGNTPLHCAILENPNLSVALFLIKQGADLSLKAAGIHLHILFQVILKAKYSNDDIMFVRMLLDNGVDENIIDPLTGRNCLHFVAITGYIQLATYLLKKGADYDVEDVTGRTPRDVAKDHEHKTLVKLFQRHQFHPKKSLSFSQNFEIVDLFSQRASPTSSIAMEGI